tara:strand:- start:736 stop:981 length:246 start_codon:yes stop_codon:yes gene_type:complete
MLKDFIRKNKTTSAIIIFIVLFVVIQRFKPSIIYEHDGSLRQFGLGNNKKTVIPIWLVSIILGILSYLFVLMFLSNNNFNF